MGPARPRGLRVEPGAGGLSGRRVLVTGLSGRIGGAVLKHLGTSHELRALNRRPVAGLAGHRADIADFAAIREAFAGIDTVVHLAALADGSAPLDAVLRNNVVGTHNVFEAARLAGVRRVVFASSGATVSGWEREMPYSALVAGRYEEAGTWPLITHETPVRPVGLYGASKVWGEALARHYADAHGLSMICLRIGHVVTEDRPLTVRDFSVWCSQRDIARMIAHAIDGPDSVRFDVFFVLSDNRWGYRDITHARDVLGWSPLDRAEDHR
ncbi:MAG TPA: NAD(P)-dependent oxidoreductase [Methylomirabilota bacterium]|nr:NAD(P)-dependent oxidoreductase [Methylomirabilota bacterium]